MTAWLEASGLVAAVSSAVALYAGSAHCRWPRLRGGPRRMRVAGVALASLSAAVWILALGAAGLCAMLVAWMLALVAQPWLALLFCRNPRGGDALLHIRQGHRPHAGSYGGSAAVREAR